MNKIFGMLRLEKGDSSFTFRKIIFILLIFWLPMLMLAIFENRALNDSLKISFLNDFAVYARFLVAIPALLYTEQLIKAIVNNTIQYFYDSGIIKENNKESFDNNLRNSFKLRDSKLVKGIILVSAYAIVLIFWKNFGKANDVSSWISGDNNGNSFSYAGYFYIFVAAPFYNFILYLMLWKYLLWIKFMWKISRMELNIYPTNPDLCAGLSFLGISLVHFALIGFAQSSVYSGEIANNIAFCGDTLSNNNFTIIGGISSLGLFYFFPSLFFMNKLYYTKIKGILEYGVLTSEQSDRFYNKWIKNKYNEFLDTGDFSSLTDLNSSYEIILKMRIIPFEPLKLLGMILIIALPFAPLAFLSFPVNEIASFLLQFFI
jgi:hypothetical protein